MVGEIATGIFSVAARNSKGYAVQGLCLLKKYYLYFHHKSIPVVKCPDKVP
jgi:hypothetical protein